MNGTLPLRGRSYAAGSSRGASALPGVGGSHSRTPMDSEVLRVSTSLVDGYPGLRGLGGLSVCSM